MKAITHTNNNGMTFRTGNNNTRMVIDETGNVGIGTPTPGAKLQVNGNILFGDGATAGYTQSGSKYIGLSSDGNAVGSNGFTGMGLESHATGGNYSQDIKFWTHNYGVFSGNPRMTIKHDGNVGIGVSNPDELLHIQNGNIKLTQTPGYYGTDRAIYSEYMDVYNNKKSGFVFDFYKNVNNDTNDFGRINVRFNGYQNETGLTSIQSGIDVASFLGNGNVGIGTTDPELKN